MGPFTTLSLIRCLREGRQRWYIISFSSQLTMQQMTQVTWLGSSPTVLDEHSLEFVAGDLIVCLGIRQLKFCVRPVTTKSQQVYLLQRHHFHALTSIGELLQLDMQKRKIFIMLNCNWSGNRDQFSCDYKEPRMVLEGLCFLVRCVLPCSTRGRQWHTLVWQEVLEACFPQHRVICSFN